jgi:DHA1 family bicyclomycin/chloramphenicol resistance-like MFS transporter
MLAGWRAIFWIVAAAGALGVVLAATQLQETRPASIRKQHSLSSVLADYGRLLADRSFVGLCLIGAFGMSAFFIYLANSSFVLINYYGLSPTVYSLFFAANAIAFIGAAQFNGSLTRRFGLSAVIRVAVGGFGMAMLTLFAAMSLGIDQLAVMTALLFVGFAFLGMTVPNATVLALERHGSVAGTASALIGAIQLAICTANMALAGVFANGRPLPMIGGIAASALAALVLANLVLRPRAPTFVR